MLSYDPRTTYWFTLPWFSLCRNIQGYGASIFWEWNPNIHYRKDGNSAYNVWNFTSLHKRTGGAGDVMIGEDKNLIKVKGMMAQSDGAAVTAMSTRFRPHQIVCLNSKKQQGLNKILKSKTRLWNVPSTVQRKKKKRKRDKTYMIYPYVYTSLTCIYM